MKAFVAFDIEKTGCLNYTHPIVSIGYVVGDSKGNLFEKKKINLLVKWPQCDLKGINCYGDFEPRCWDEFWSKRPSELLKALQQNALSQEEGLKQFAEFLNSLELKYESIVFLSDNASFDIAALDVNLERYAKRNPLRYSTTGKYRSLLPPDDLFETLSVEQQNELSKKYITPFVVHDHDPSNDAEFIYRQYIAYLHR